MKKSDKSKKCTQKNEVYQESKDALDEHIKDLVVKKIKGGTGKEIKNKV